MAPTIAIASNTANQVGALGVSYRKLGALRTPRAILARGDGFRAIGVAIGRSHTTVAREVNRSGGEPLCWCT
jgi:hypothetical protein